MNTIKLLRALFFGFVFALCIGVSLGGGPPTPIVWNLNENGIGSTVSINGGPATPLAFLASALDPGPGGHNTLSYSFGFNVAPADLILTSTSGISDVLRIGGAPGVIYFYSADTGGGLLADTGLPSAFTPITFSLAENEFGVTSYTPLPGQPGYVPGIAATYNILSGPFGVPEGGTSMVLLGLGLCGLVSLRRTLVR